MAFQTHTNGASSPAPTAKPAILCLHGGGTNTIIFEVQMIRIHRILSSEFEFVYLDAPFPSGPGPDVLPTFDGCGPYFRWTQDVGPETPERTKAILARSAKEQIAKDGRGFVGILGFSQGARMAAGLLLEHQLGKGIDWGVGLRFGVLCNGITAPLTSHLSKEENALQVTIPTLHLVGLTDPWREESRKLRSVHCQQEQTTLLEFDVGHRLPLLPQDNLKIAAWVRSMYRETSPIGQVTLNVSPYLT
jgi:predicted esterase